MSTASTVFGLFWAKHKEKTERIIRYFQSKEAFSVRSAISEKELTTSLLKIEGISLAELDQNPFLVKTSNAKRYLDNFLLSTYRKNDIYLSIFLIIGLVVLIMVLKYLFS